MRVDEDRAILARLLSPFAIVFASLCLLAAPTVFAQDDDSMESLDDLAELEDESAVEEVIVTGSRLKRDTFTSIAPLQVMTGEIAREIGSIDAATILQESTSAAGAQIDLTFAGLVLENGPGTQTLDLRGLGASRTLILINGRRAAPAGVEGAPVSPDIGMIPSSLVQRYENLLDGASSIYGSDAIAGVSNIILRKDFDGFEVETYSELPAGGNSEGLRNTISLAWGYNGDRGFVGAAVDYAKYEPITYDDRAWTAGCNMHMEETTTGEIRNESLLYQFDYGMKTSPCKIGFGRRAWDNSGLFGSIYRTPGTSNVGIPNLSESTMIGLVLDLDEDGVPDVDFHDYNLNGALGHGYMMPDYERMSGMAYGEYTFAGEANITPFFEILYNRRDVFQYDAGSWVGQDVPGSNPYNPCNPNGIDGVDCGQAFTDLMFNPVYVEDFIAAYGWICPAFYGLPESACSPAGFGYPTGPIGPSSVQAQFSISGDRDTAATTIGQLRFVGGVRGDMPFMNTGSLEDWSFEVSVVASESDGESLRQGINGDRLEYSLENSVLDEESGTVSCGEGCVPVNLFHPALYEGLAENNFGSQAERDYLFANREFDTVYKQTLFQAWMAGDLFELPAGEVMASFGVEYRVDEIDSIPNAVAAEGQLWGFFSDRGAVGDKDTREFFVEVEAPLLAGVPAFEELTVNLSTRHTKDEYYGGAWTYSAKLAWRPVDSLLLRGTVGTSYRAPNLRENFMLGQTGFRGLFDPCVVPEAAIDTPGIPYDPADDDREAHVIANCIAAGVDPTTLGIIAQGQSSSVYSVEVAGVGQLGLDEEKSESFTAGFAWEQPFFETFDLTLGATYYEISIRDQIIRLHSALSINDCYYDLEGDSAFCDNIIRDPDSGLIDFMNEIFLNQDQTTTRGVDINVALDWPTELFGRSVDLSMDMNFNRKLGFREVFTNPNNGVVDTDDYIGEFGFPEWEGLSIFRADIGDWRVSWSTRYISGVAQDPLGVDEWSNVTGIGDTCLGEDNGDVDCRDIGYADNYFRHDASLTYRADSWLIRGGLRNVFDEAPPQVDNSEVGGVYNNTPMGRGYDIYGRTFFLNLQMAFE